MKPLVLKVPVPKKPSRKRLKTFMLIYMKYDLYLFILRKFENWVKINVLRILFGQKGENLIGISNNRVSQASSNTKNWNKSKRILRTNLCPLEFFMVIVVDNVFLKFKTGLSLICMSFNLKISNLLKFFR